MPHFITNWLYHWLTDRTPDLTGLTVISRSICYHLDGCALLHEKLNTKMHCKWEANTPRKHREVDTIIRWIQRKDDLINIYRAKLQSRTMRWKKKKKKKKEKLTRVNMVPWYPVPKQNSVLYSFKRPWVVHAFLTQFIGLCARQILWFQLLWKAFPTTCILLCLVCLLQRKPTLSFAMMSLNCKLTT